MENLKIFENQEFGKIRSVMVNNEPYFVAKDVCEILEIKNTTDSIKRLDDDEVTRFNLGGLVGEVNIVNEYGLYNLILASRKKEAKAFKKWITHEVIPSIRKTGGYIAGENDMDEDELVLKAMNVLSKKIENLKQKNQNLLIENKQKNQIICELEPKVDYLDKILKSKSLVTTTAIAKDYGMSANKLNKILHNLKIQFKQGNQWFLYSKYQCCGYTHSKITEFYRNNGVLDTSMTTEWTQKGRLFLYEILKNNGIIPQIEK